MWTGREANNEQATRAIQVRPVTLIVWVWVCTGKSPIPTACTPLKQLLSSSCSLRNPEAASGCNRSRAG
jgi:hypothetical protein